MHVQQNLETSLAFQIQLLIHIRELYIRDIYLLSTFYRLPQVTESVSRGRLTNLHSITRSHSHGWGRDEKWGKVGIIIAYSVTDLYERN